MKRYHASSYMILTYVSHIQTQAFKQVTPLGCRILQQKTRRKFSWSVLSNYHISTSKVQNL